MTSMESYSYRYLASCQWCFVRWSDTITHQLVTSAQRNFTWKAPPLPPSIINRIKLHYHHCTFNNQPIILRKKPIKNRIKPIYFRLIESRMICMKTSSYQLTYIFKDLKFIRTSLFKRVHKPWSVAWDSCHQLNTFKLMANYLYYKNHDRRQVPSSSDFAYSTRHHSNYNGYQLRKQLNYFKKLCAHWVLYEDFCDRYLTWPKKRLNSTN